MKSIVKTSLESAVRVVLDREEAWASEYWPQHRQRIADDIELIAKFPGRILEVGSAPYFTTLTLSWLGRDIVGIDINPTSAPDEVQVLGCDIECEPLPVDDGTFDVVVFSEVFEHLRIDPIFTISELGRVLAPGGVLLLTTPNLRSLRGLLRLALLGKGWAVGAHPLTEYRKLSEQGWMGHVREYTALEVTDFVEGCGLVVDRIVWRRKPGTWWQETFERVFKPSRPYMTLIVQRGDFAASDD